MEIEKDDFANDKEIQRQRKAQKDYELMIKECEGEIARQLSLEPADCTEIGSFLIFNSLDSPAVVESYRSSSGNLTIEIYRVEYRFTFHIYRGTSSGHEQCFLGLLTSQKNYPPTCIYRETLKAKISDWFTKQDLDFAEQKKFSDSFYVVTKDKEKLSIQLMSKQLDELSAFPDAEIELNGNHCLFRASDKPLSADETKKFIELAQKLSKILS